ncbi:hypothetical protein EPO14_03740 [Patescibacteria group bacterium]|nr:MAG: hypothetical protein EPO14_03740 [Patescibacteria group bacterium]
MGEISSIEGASVSGRPRKKGSIWATLGIAGALAGTAPASADAQDFNWGQFGRGLVGGLVQGQREREGQERCLQTQIPSAEELVFNAENEFETATARAHENADSALESLSHRTDLTPRARDIEERRVQTNRLSALNDARSRLAMAYHIADERVRSCTPRR